MSSLLMVLLRPCQFCFRLSTGPFLFVSFGRDLERFDDVVLAPSCPEAFNKPDTDSGSEVTSCPLSDGERLKSKPESCLRRSVRNAASSAFCLVVDGCNGDTTVVVEHVLIGLDDLCKWCCR